MISVGLFKGRHEMPCTEFLFPEGQAGKHGYHQGIYDEAFRRAQNFATENSIVAGVKVAFYATGLTIACMGAVDGWRSLGVTVVYMNYDRDSGTYREVRVAPRFTEAQKEVLRGVLSRAEQNAWSCATSQAQMDEDYKSISRASVILGV